MEEIPTLSLLGGPLHRLGKRLGLVRGETNTFPLGIALALFSWLGAMVLATMEGLGDYMLTRPTVGGHIRLLAVIPLLFLCESVLAPRVAELVPTLVRSGIVPRKSLPALAKTITRVNRWEDHWLPEALALAGMFIVAMVGPRLGIPGMPVPRDPRVQIALAGQWYWLVCLTLFRFLLLRWAWRIALWCFFLWRLARLELHLVPTHPDGAAGLGYLEVVQSYFAPLAFALSVIQSAAFADDYDRGATTFEALYPTVVVLLLVDAALFLGPTVIFAPNLWACRVKGLRDYMELAARYTNGFDTKWLATGLPASSALLGTPDLQSLADLSTSVDVVRTMRWAPVSKRLVVDLTAAALVPLLPLFLLKYPIAELSQRLFSRLTGL